MSDGPARTRLAGAALVALATTLMLEGMRVFVSYLVFVVDQSQRVELATTTFGVFLAIGLGGLLARLLGARRALLICAALCGLARLALQFWEAPTPRVVLGAAVVISWGWLLVAALDGGLPRESVAQGVTLGLGLDVALRIAFGSLDLPWDPTPAQHIATLLLMGGLLASAWFVMHGRYVAEPSAGSNLPLIAVGPGLALFHLVSGNLGFSVAQVKDVAFSYPAMLSLLAISVFAGCCGPAWAERSLVQIGHPRLVAAGYAALMLVALWLTPHAGPTILALVVWIHFQLLQQALLAPAPFRMLRPHSAAVWLTAGMLLQAAILFLYYSSTGSATLIYVAAALLAVGSLLARIPHPNDPPRRRERLALAGVVGAVLAVACAWQFATWDPPHAQAAQLGDEFTVMTYNLQSGYARDKHWSLEAQARTIEAQQPDIVILEEVSRGWLVTTGNDELLWLSQRLDMPYVWGPASDDGLWGNAILSRVALSEQDTTKFASTQNLKRGAVRARVTTPAGELWVYGTHLDNPNGAGAVRSEQIDELLRYIGSNQPAIIGGDLNATPSSDVLAALRAANFNDASAQLGPAATTTDDGKRIDYLLLRGQLTLIEARIPDIWTSDHRPFVVRVRVGE